MHDERIGAPPVPPAIAGLEFTLRARASAGVALGDDDGCGAGLAIAVIVALVMMLAEEAGFRLQLLIGRGATPSESTDGASYIAGAALGLLSLLIGFTFALSADRYETRRRLVVEEANAISTTWLRQQLLDDPQRSRLAAMMADYVKAREAVVGAGLGPSARIDSGTEALQAGIWRETGIALRTPTGAPYIVPLLTSTNQMFDLASSRRAELEAHVPTAILWVLILYATATAAMTGYNLSASRRRHRAAASALCVLTALGIFLIVDLDYRPHHGSIQVPDTALRRVAGQIVNARPAAVGK